MNPQDIDRIANAVVNSLAGPGPGLLGCGAVSSTIQYFTDEELDCTDYQCGGRADFGCCEGFACSLAFWCDGASFACNWGAGFECADQYSCLDHNPYYPSWWVCPPPGA